MVRKIYNYELSKEGGFVFIQWTDEKGGKSEWLPVGEAPIPKGWAH